MADRYGPPAPISERPLRAKMQGHKGPLRFALRVGQITRIDYENFVCDIQWRQGATPPAREVQISGSYWSKRGFLGAMPEVGSVVICGFSAAHEDAAIKPYILSYLPNGFQTALGFDPFGFAERDTDEINQPLQDLQRELDGIYGPTRHKFRKIYPGDIYAASDKGAELILDTDAHLFSKSGGELWLRSEDQSLITTTLDSYTTTAATRRRSGRITRSALTLPVDLTVGENARIEPDTVLYQLLLDAGLIFEDGSFPPDINQLPYIPLESGERLGLVTENLADVTDPDVRVFTEDRMEIQEFTDQRLPYPDHYGFDGDKIGEAPAWSLFIERVVGTVVGNDPYSARGRSQYGKLLKPVLFDTPNATSGQARLEPVQNSAQSDEKGLAGAYLYRMQRPDGLGEMFVSHDKEGHVFLSIPASTSKKSNLGAGRSVEAELKGSAKVVMGANKNDRSSLDLNMTGGMKWTLGTLNTTNRSLDLNARGGLGLKIGADLDGASVTGEMAGDMGLALEGSMGVSVTEDYIVEANGQMSTSAEAQEQSVGNGDFNQNVLSNINRNIKGQVTSNIGEGRKTTIAKPSTTGPSAEELRILTGNRQTTFGAPATDTITFASSGSRTVQSTGPLTATWQSATSGNFSFQATGGTYSVTLGSGVVSMTAANINLTGSTNVTITAPNINVTGRVALGNPTAALAVVGGVPGPSPYIDPLTGLPLTGNPLVNVPAV